MSQVFFKGSQEYVGGSRDLSWSNQKSKGMKVLQMKDLKVYNEVLWVTPSVYR